MSHWLLGMRSIITSEVFFTLLNLSLLKILQCICYRASRGLDFRLLTWHSAVSQNECHDGKFGCRDVSREWIFELDSE